MGDKSGIFSCREKFEVDGREYAFLNPVIFDESVQHRFGKLPFCIRILYENAVRMQVSSGNAECKIWRNTRYELLDYVNKKGKSILFKPSRVLLHDFTGLSTLIDMAALRHFLSQEFDHKLAERVDSQCPADLVVDHSVQLDFSQILTERKKEDQVLKELQSTVLATPCESYLSSSPFSSSPSISPMASTLILPSAFCSAANNHFTPNNTDGSLYTVPRDNPGLPVFDPICPFHQRPTFWASHLHAKHVKCLETNSERFDFIKRTGKVFDNVTVIPPGSGYLHGINLEYLTRLVVKSTREEVTKSSTCFLHIDSVIGTDSHTSTSNGLGVLSLTSGTLDAEARMFGHPISINIPSVMGCYIEGVIPMYATATDVVLYITKTLRNRGVSGMIVEFNGCSLSELSVVDRIAICNMCPEYGAYLAYFPVDDITLDYVTSTGQKEGDVVNTVMRRYLESCQLMVTAREGHGRDDIQYSDVIHIDLGHVQACISGPKTTRDKSLVHQVSEKFKSLLMKPPSFHPGAGQINNRDHLGSCLDGFGLGFHDLHNAISIFSPISTSQVSTITHGSVIFASLTSCSNTTNPSVMLQAGLMAKKAVELGLTVPEYVDRKISPGSGVVVTYLHDSGVMPYLHMLGFEITGYGCSTCVSNNAQSPASKTVRSVIFGGGSAAAHDGSVGGNIVCCGVLSGNRNFEGRAQSNMIQANYLTSPLLVVAYALAGRIDIDFTRESLNNRQVDNNSTPTPVYLKDIWPSREEVRKIERQVVIPNVFRNAYNRIKFDEEKWASVTEVTATDKNRDLDLSSQEDRSVHNFYKFVSKSSSYITLPNYIRDVVKEVGAISSLRSFDHKLRGMRCLIKLGDNVTSDYISPAGSIVRNSPAADYLTNKLGLAPRHFNSYGARRGNFEVMVRGTFSHVKITNHMLLAENTRSGPYTLHLPSELPTSIYEASKKYKSDRVSLYGVAGKNLGRGAARDWASKGPALLGIKVMMAVSFDPSYRSNLIRVGILPVQIDETTYEIITGCEKVSIDFDDEIFSEDLGGLTNRDMTECEIILNEEFDLKAKICIENSYEWRLYKDGGIVKQLVKSILSQQ